MFNPVAEWKETPGLERCVLPKGHVRYDFNERDVTITLLPKCCDLNMQDDAAAVEAWCLALLAAGAERVRIDTSQLQHETKHRTRLAYRLAHFCELFPMVEDADGLSSEVFGCHSDRLLLNQPLSEADRIPSSVIAELIDPNGPESRIETAFEVLPELKRAFSPNGHQTMRVMRQWPVGLFNGEVAHKSRIFTGGKSAIDLIAIDGETLLLFELKNGKNKKIGALSEIFFYACVMRDLLLKRFQFEEGRILDNLAISRAHIMQCREVRAVILAPRLHPLIWNEKGRQQSKNVVDLLNEATAREWGVNVPVRFEAWTFKPAEANDFEFTRRAPA
jgi:hypothetical protein